MNPGNHLSEPIQGPPSPGMMYRALTRDPAKLRILFACTLAAVATAFEPTYLTLSTSFVQAGLRTPDSGVPMFFAVMYLLLALVTLIAGATADLFGRRLFLLLGMGGLMVSNLLSWLWLGSPQFVYADILNAISGVVVLPAAIAIVTLTFEPVVRPLAYGIFFTIQGAAIVIAPLLIPALGGEGDAGAAFVPVLLIGVATIWMISRHIPESVAPTSLRRGNIIVNLILISGIFWLIFLVATSQIRTQGVLAPLAVAGLLLLFGVVIRWLARKLRQFKGIEIYGGRNLGFAIYSGVMLMFAQGCFFYNIGPYWYDVQQLEGLEAILRYLPYVIGLLLGGLLIARLSLRFGARRILALSFLLLGVAMLGLSFLEVDSSYWIMLLPVILIGVAGGLGGPARTQVVLSAPPEGLVGEAAAVNTAAGQAGYSLGVIVSSVLVTRYADRIFLDALTAAGVSPETVSSISAALNDLLLRLVATVYPQLPETVTQLTGVSYAEGFTSGMTRMFFWVALAMFVSALALYFGMHRGVRASAAVPPPVSETPDAFPQETQDTTE
jgi:MFS transporter, DHA2 family, multidrug resistance protein